VVAVTPGVDTMTTPSVVTMAEGVVNVADSMVMVTTNPKEPINIHSHDPGSRGDGLPQAELGEAGDDVVAGDKVAGQALDSAEDSPENAIWRTWARLREHVPTLSETPSRAWEKWVRKAWNYLPSQTWQHRANALVALVDACYVSQIRELSRNLGGVGWEGADNRTNPSKLFDLDQLEARLYKVMAELDTLSDDAPDLDDVEGIAPPEVTVNEEQEEGGIKVAGMLSESNRDHPFTTAKTLISILNDNHICTCSCQALFLELSQVYRYLGSSPQAPRLDHKGAALELLLVHALESEAGRELYPSLTDLMENPEEGRATQLTKEFVRDLSDPQSLGQRLEQAMLWVQKEVGEV